MSVRKINILIFSLFFSWLGSGAVFGASGSGEIDVGIQILPVDPPGAPTFEITVIEDKAYFVGQAVFSANIHILITQDLSLMVHAVTISDENGDWSYVTDALEKGEYDVVIYAIDAAERVSPNANGNFEITYEEPEETVDDEEEDEDDDEEETVRQSVPEETTPAEKTALMDEKKEKKNQKKDEKNEEKGDIIEVCPPEGISKKDLFFSGLRLYDLIMAIWYLSLVMLPIFLIFFLLNRKKDKEK